MQYNNKIKNFSIGSEIVGPGGSISHIDSISNGFIKNNIQVFNFSDRYFQTKNNFISIDSKILEIVKNISPELLLLGHTNSIKLETLEIVKKVSPETKISFWYEDSINKLGPDYFQNKFNSHKFTIQNSSKFLCSHKFSFQNSINI